MKAIHFFKSFGAELLIIFSLLFLINNYLGNVESRINADGVGYYDYLPSLVIHKDFVRKNDTQKSTPELYQRLNNLTGQYVDYGSYKVNKYPCGTAILVAPFFTATYLTHTTENSEADGYQAPYHTSIFIAALFYLFFALIFIKKTLQLYSINQFLIFFTQILVVFSTSVIHYTNAEPGFSHVYSLFAISAFIYVAKLFFVHGKFKHFLTACSLLGLIFLLRNPNIIIFFFVPFLAGSKAVFISRVKSIFQHYKMLIAGFCIFSVIASVQLLVWYFQTGDFFVYSYQGESFDFLHPHFIDILFSYKKGLFVYTPILFIALLSTVWLLYKKRYFELLTWYFFFILLTYFLSSWWSWFYGCSFGLRAYIDFYLIFFIPFAIALNQLNRWFKLAVIALSISTIPVCIIQSFQYKAFILDWIEMDKEKFWSVFLKTEDKYIGLAWKTNNFADFTHTVYEKDLGDFYVKPNEVKTIFLDTLSSLSKDKVYDNIQISLDGRFLEADDSQISISIEDSTQNYYWFAPYTIRFNTEGLGKPQRGRFNYAVQPELYPEGALLKVLVWNDDQSKTVENITLKLGKK